MPDREKDTTSSSKVITSGPTTKETTTNEPATSIKNTRTAERVTSSNGSTVTREFTLTLMQTIFILYQLIKLLF